MIKTTWLRLGLVHNRELIFSTRLLKKVYAWTNITGYFTRTTCRITDTLSGKFPTQKAFLDYSPDRFPFTRAFKSPYEYACCSYSPDRFLFTRAFKSPWICVLFLFARHNSVGWSHFMNLQACWLAWQCHTNFYVFITHPRIASSPDLPHFYS